MFSAMLRNGLSNALSNLYDVLFVQGLVWRILAEQSQIRQKHIFFYDLHSTIFENLIFFQNSLVEFEKSS